jgi:uncharacterized protein (TIGR00290 family)
MSWSGGKDAALALYRMRHEGLAVRFLLTTVSERYRRISMHGVRETLLRQQARQVGIPLKVLYLPENATQAAYDRLMAQQLHWFAQQGIRYGIYGDIFLADLRRYREEQLSRAGMETLFPLWGSDTRLLVKEFLDLGFRARVSCVNARQLDRSFAGRELDSAFLADLPEGVDACGENGEYHTFVHQGPLFPEAVPCRTGRVVERVYGASSSDDAAWDNRFYFCDLLP